MEIEYSYLFILFYDRPVLSGVRRIANAGQDLKIESIKKGSIWLFLKEKETSEAKLKDKVGYVTGQVIMHDKHSTFATTIFSVQGVVLREIGKLTLYGNRPEGKVQLVYHGNDTRNESLEDNLHFQENNMYYDVKEEVSVGRRSRFRKNGGNTGVNTCMFEMDLNLNASGGRYDTPSMDGMVGSENCGIYMNVSTHFEVADLSSFLSKASHYAVIMSIIAMLQIHFLVKQIQFSASQAGAAKISLISIGQQAIIDSYLCLVHLTAGIVAQSIFMSFATVAFFKLVLFSIFEMRYLLLIWKARRSAMFAEGWIVMRRELTVLYTRFYGCMLLGVLILYNGWNYMDVLIIVAYSFWVPQIIHNAHQECRKPLLVQYLLGNSAMRLLLPMYVYGCPYNFLSAFPTNEQQPEYGTCIILLVWVALQIGVLLLQDKFGARFFIPARFLPVKYSYTHDIDSEQLSLLRASDESEEIDCVICMNEIDIKTKEYMIAPCDHIFHPVCLQEWMNVKMECPTCRSVLPPP